MTTKSTFWSRLKQKTALVLVASILFSNTTFAAENNYNQTAPRTIERAVYCIETEGQATLNGLVSIIETLNQGQQATLESIFNGLSSNNDLIRGFAFIQLLSFLESQANLTQEVINSIITFLTNDNLLHRLRTCFRAPLAEIETPVDPSIAPTVVFAFVLTGGEQVEFTGRIENPGDSEINQKGFYYRESHLTTDQNIILVNEHALNEQLEYTSQVDLTCETEYTVLAFANNGAGIGSSNELTFTTQDCPDEEPTEPTDPEQCGLGTPTSPACPDTEPTPQEECELAGGVWTGVACFIESPEEQACKDAGGTWENDQCTPEEPTEQQTACENHSGVWDEESSNCTCPEGRNWNGETLICETAIPGDGGDDNDDEDDTPNNGGGRNNGGSSSGSRVNRPATNDDVILQSEEIVELQSGDLCQEFRDIETNWAKTEIETLRQMEVVCGRAPGQFVADGETTRAEFSKIIVKTLKLEMGETEVPTFSDVASTDWFIGYINTLVSNNGINGNADGTFNPHNFITKTDLLTALRILLPENLEWITENIKFNSEGEFVTRAEAAKIAMQVYELKK